MRELAFPSLGAHAEREGAVIRLPTHYLKFDLGENDAFGKAQWLSSVRGATPFETNIEALGVKSIMLGASGAIGVNELYYVIKVDDIGGLGSGVRQRWLYGCAAVWPVPCDGHRRT